MKRSLLAALLTVFLLSGALAQSVQRFAELGDFRLESGQTLRNCRIGYRTFGTLNADRSNAVLVPTWFTGTSDAKKFVASPGGIADSTRFFVIVVDALGNGVSSSPSNSTAQPGAQFPTVSIRDMVRSQFELITKHLAISRLYAVMGISMGGMQTFQWLVSYPDRLDKAVPIIGTPQQSSYDKLFWGTQLNVLERGGYRPDAMKSVGALHEMNLWTPTYHQQHRSPEAFAGYLAQKESDYERQNPYDWACQLRAMIGHDIFSGKPMADVARQIRAKVLVVVATQDHMVNPAPALAFAKVLGAPVTELTGDCGHMATSCESVKMQEAIRTFLAK